MTVAQVSAPPWGARFSRLARGLTHDPLGRAGVTLLALLALTALFFRIPALASNQALAGLFRCLLVPGLLAAYLGGYRSLQALPDASGRRRAVVGFGIAFCAAALLIVPFDDIDLCCYVNIGWQQAHYGLNPYVYTPSEAPGWGHDTMFRPYWQFTPSPYGFLFNGLAWLVCRLGNGHWWLTVQLFRAVNVIAFGLTGWVVWACCRRLGRPHPERALYLLLWNPLLLMTALVHGHNDILMALFASLAVYFAVTRRPLPVLPALMAAILVKHLAGPLLPFAFLLLGRRHGWRKACLSAALGLLPGAVLALPYVGQIGEFRLAGVLEAVTELHNSPAALLYFPFEVWARLSPSGAPSGSLVLGALKVIGWAAFLAFYVRLAWLRLRERIYTPATLLRDGVLMQFVLVCLVSPKFYPWYLGMFLPPALCLPAGDWLRRAVLAVSCAQLLSLTFINQAHFVNVLVMLVLPLGLALRLISWPPLPPAVSHLAGRISRRLAGTSG